MKKIKIHISEEPHCREFESLGSIFKPIMRDALPAESFVEADIILSWIDIVGMDIAKFCNPLKTKFDPINNQRTLFVEVPAGGFALELRHREDYILDKINAYMGYKAVHQLNITQNINMRIRNFSIKQEVQPVRELNEDEKKYLEELVAEIKDEKLRENLVKLGTNVILSRKGDE